MPQISTTTSTPGGYVIATMQAAVNALITAMAAGRTIFASDVAAINSSVYNLWRSHTHSVSDRQGQDTFGNVTVYGVGGTAILQTSSATSPAFGVATTPAGIAVDQPITAADINVMIGIVNNMRVHSHTMFDGAGATFPVVNITNGTYGTIVSGAGGTIIGRFQNDGNLVIDGTGVASQWINMRPVDVATAGAYEVRISTPVLVVGTGTTSGTFNTWLPLSTTRTFSVTETVAGDVSFDFFCQIRDASTLVVVDSATLRLEVQQIVFFTCFPAGSKVLMADGSWKNIELLKPADMVMGADGNPAAIEQVDRPILGNRKLLSFADRSLTWSEEHAMWTRDATQSQWWWTYNAEMWAREATSGAIGGLTDNASMRTGDQAVEWAHVVAGWKPQTVEELAHPGMMTRLYLPRTSGVPIIVNGYVVGAGVNQQGFDYSTLDWSQVHSTFPVVDPLPTV